MASVPWKSLSSPHHTPSALTPQKFHLVPSINAVSGSQELQWMVQPHFLGPGGYPRPLTYPQYSPPQPRPGVIRALGPPPGVRRRPCEQVRNRGVALSIALRGPRRQGTGSCYERPSIAHRSPWEAEKEAKGHL